MTLRVILVNSKLLSILFIVPFLCACSGSGPIVQPPITKTLDAPAEYLIGIGDQLNVSVWKNPDLSVAVPVRPDGKISTPLVGDVLAAGYTPAQLAERLTMELADYIRNPKVTVIINAPHSSAYLNRVRITGAVGQPRSLMYRKGMRVLDIVLDSGGLTDFADGNDAKLYRENTEAIVEAYPIYIDDILSGKNLESNFELQPGDMITVPERSF